MQRRRRSPAKWLKEQMRGVRITGGFVSALLIAALLALFSLGAAAGTVGISIPAFRAGSPFTYPDLRRVDARDAAFMGKKVSSSKASAHVREARALLVSAPLSSAVVRSIALGRDAMGDKRGAARSMAFASRLSRRDGLTQMWLANAALRQSRAKAGLWHFDTFLRTYSVNETQPAIEQMVGILRFPEARKELAPYVSTSNPWYERFMGVAVGRAQVAADVADLLLRARSVPDSPYLRGYYASLFERLIAEKAYSPALRLYPRLPGAKPRVLRTVAVTPESLEIGYAPAIWSFADDADWGGAPIDTPHGAGLEFYAQPDTVGTPGQKLVELAPKGGRQFLYWTVVERQAISGSTARWTLRCLDSPQIRDTQSINLMSVKPGTRFRMAAPTGCGLALLRMDMVAGVGRDAARVVVGSLAIVAEPADLTDTRAAR